MMRSSPASSMQKTYDECYLICSTAVYFEKQNNEAEALKSWRAALDQIYYHNAYKIPASYRPKTETEKALQESLHDMELQCKERVDLLDALRKSRLEAVNAAEPWHPSLNGSRNNSHSSVNTFNEGSYLGTGETNVPTVNYHDLARPATQQAPSPQPISRRPVQSTGKVIQSEAERLKSTLPSQQTEPNKNPSFSGPSLSVAPRKTSRTPSPKGKTLKTTLRGRGKDSSRSSSSKMASTMRSRPPDAAKAATLAWAPPPLAVTSQTGLSTNHSNVSNPSLKSFDRKTSVDESLTPTDLGLPRKDLLRRTPSPSEKFPLKSSTNYHVLRPPSFDDSNNSNSNATLIDVSDPRSYHGSPNPTRVPLNVANRYQGSTLTPTLSTDHSALAAAKPSSPPIFTDAASATLTATASVVSAPPAPAFPSYRREYPKVATLNAREIALRTKPPARSSKDDNTLNDSGLASNSESRKPLPPKPRKASSNHPKSSPTKAGDSRPDGNLEPRSKQERDTVSAEASNDHDNEESSVIRDDWEHRVAYLMKHLPRGVDEAAAKAIFNEIVVKGDEVHWEDVAGLEIAKTALKEAVVYPFLRPDLFLGLREPARGMLLFGPPGTGKTMLARAVATESKSTFFAISASSLTSKYLGESEKLVRALFSLAKALAPSIIFVDEIDSLLSSRGGGAGEHEATRRIKTEFLIQWSDLAKAAAGRETSEREKTLGDATRVLVLAATNLPWAIDEAARRRFVRRQYIPLPEAEVREDQLRRLISAQKHNLSNRHIQRLVELTDGFSGSDITALAKDAAMGPLRSLGEDLLRMTPDEIRGIEFQDFQASLINIRPSVSKQGLKQYEQWAADFGERGG